MKQVPINDENKPSNLKESNGRITRARTKALGSAGGLPPLHPSRKMDDKQIPRANSKRAASENSKPGVMSDTCSQHKKRAVLKDVTNVSCEKLYSNCINAARGQHSNLDKKSCIQKTGKAAPASFAKVQGNNRGKEVEEMYQVTVEESKAISSTVTTKPAEVPSAKILGGASVIPKKMIVNRHIPLPSPSNRGSDSITASSCCRSKQNSEVRSLMENKRKIKKELAPATSMIDLVFTNEKQRYDYAEVLKFRCNEKSLEDRDIVDIDAQHHDPKMCSLYAADIYSSLHAKQFDHRPLMDYMGKLQQDITQGMRGILVDWLVEVSEEYTLVPDTLYLTVNLIDRFLSENYIQKQKLQLLGVTCMLIASKYEEICAPRVEEFCIITDNTYTKEEVMKMESRVLNLLGFKLSVPTTKNFLRRYIQAAQISYKVPSVELEFLANYLAELTLTEYSFLKFLPSLIAASAVFLARWTLDQSDQPWNPTLEHYTGRKMFELKSVVLELQDLQLNTSGSMLNAIREKYKQSKFKAVSTLRSPKPVELLF